MAQKAQEKIDNTGLKIKNESVAVAGPLNP